MRACSPLHPVQIDRLTLMSSYHACLPQGAACWWLPGRLCWATFASATASSSARYGAGIASTCVVNCMYILAQCPHTMLPGLGGAALRPRVHALQRRAGQGHERAAAAPGQSAGTCVCLCTDLNAYVEGMDGCVLTSSIPQPPPFAGVQGAEHGALHRADLRSAADELRGGCGGLID